MRAVQKTQSQLWSFAKTPHFLFGCPASSTYTYQHWWLSGSLTPCNCRTLRQKAIIDTSESMTKQTSKGSVKTLIPSDKDKRTRFDDNDDDWDIDKAGVCIWQWALFSCVPFYAPETWHSGRGPLLVDLSRSSFSSTFVLEVIHFILLHLMIVSNKFWYLWQSHFSFTFAVTTIGRLMRSNISDISDNNIILCIILCSRNHWR